MASDCTRGGDGDAGGSQNETGSDCEKPKDEASNLCDDSDQQVRRSLYEEGDGSHHGHDGMVVVSESESVRGDMSMRSLHGRHHDPSHGGGPDCDPVRDAPSHGCGQCPPPARVRCHAAFEPPRLPSPELSNIQLT